MYLAVDIGATKVLLAVLTAKGEILEQRKFATPAEYKDLVAAIRTNVGQLSRQSFKRVVVAVPARLNRKAGVAIAFGNRDWQNIPIQRDLEKTLDCPVIIENDAKLAALSEAILIKDEFKKVLYVTISTGISSGLIINGNIDPELADSESGQMWLEYHGKLTQWEDFASGRAIVEQYGMRASEINDPKIWKEIAHNIAIGLIQLLAIIQPEVVIIGGGVGTHYAKFKKYLSDELNHFALPIVPIPPIRKAIHPEEAVIYGCFELVRHA